MALPPLIDPQPGARTMLASMLAGLWGPGADRTPGHSGAIGLRRTAAPAGSMGVKAGSLEA